MRTWLKDLRKNLHLTQSQLAEKIGVDVTLIGKIENGSRRPSVKTAMKIADTLGFEWTRFYDGEQDVG